MKTTTARSHHAADDNNPPIRVLIIDDSVVARAALSRIIEEVPDFALVAALDGARRAIDWLATTSVDVILLDIQMPGLDGIAALPELIAASGGAQILVVSSLAAEGGRATVQALSMGAADTLAKPQVGGLGRFFAQQLIDKMRRLGTSAPKVRQIVERESYELRTVAKRPVGCLAIGASTGGLHALGAFFAGLPKSFDAPILVTQHLPHAFMSFFADQLTSLSGRPAHVAADGDILKRGEILIAPGTHHLSCARVANTVRVVLSDHPVESRCCPSVDPMLQSVAGIFGESAMAVILTGMGRDGVNGAQAIAETGGCVIAQDVGSSAVWGMPGTVVRLGLATMVASPPALAAYVTNCRAAQ